MLRLDPDNTFVAPKRPRNGKDLRRLVIAEAPGREESEAGEPLVGGAGRLFDELIAGVGIDRDGLTIINCINCRPPGNVFPTDAAIRGSYEISKADAEASVQQCYKNYVLPILSEKWDRVDLLGSKALRIIGGETVRIGLRRGLLLKFSPNLRGVAIYHPAYLRRNRRRKPSLLIEAANDLKRSLSDFQLPNYQISQLPNQGTS